MNKQAIAGVVPADRDEVTVMTVWPSVARYPLGQFLGELYANRLGFYIFTLGNLIALATIPVGLVLYFVRVGQGVCYRLTNRRILEMQFNDVRKYVALDGFDAIDVVQHPGQLWFKAGDLVFRQGGTEVFRLTAVPHPESFRQTCLKSHLAHVSVRQVLQREAVRV